MNIKYYLLPCLIMSFVFASCGPKTNDKGETVIPKPGTDQEIHIKFFPNGNVDYIQEVKNEVPEGFFMNFFENGRIQNTSTLVGGKKDGPGFIFHPNGQLKSMGVYKNDQQQGYFWLFDTEGNLLEKREYLDIDGKNVMNQWIRLDPNLTPLVAESNFLMLDAGQDTVREGEAWVLRVSLEASFNREYMALIVGPFDEQYRLPAGSVCDTIPGKNFIATYQTVKYKRGLNTLRGAVKDISYDQDTEKSKIRTLYFAKDFWVLK